MLRRLPFFKILAIGQLALLARRHLQQLTPAERRRLMQLARRAWKLEPTERKEVRQLVSKLEPRAFAGGAADAFSPFPLPKRHMGGRRR